jgi:hypothetical protein
MRGRLPSGPEYIDKLEGEREEKERLKAILATMFGEMRLLEACAEMGIGETRFHQLRELALQAALEAIARRPAGRPSLASFSEAEEIRRQALRIEELELALHEAEVREEIALVLSQGDARDDDAQNGEGKKMSSPHVKIRKPR